MMCQRERLRDVTKFNPTVLIGNWSEDRELQRSLLKDLLASKAMGTTRLDTFHYRMQQCLSEVDLTKVHDDEYVHIGDVLQLVHVDTGCVLACDPNDKDQRPGEEACAATAAPEVRAPCARNTLLLVKYKSPKPAHVLQPEYEGSAVRYGQKVRLALHPGATGQQPDRAGGPRPLFLFSKPVSTTHYAKYSRQQLVGFTLRDTFDTVWQVVTPDPAMRPISEGVEVMAGAPVLLVHCATQKPLCLEGSRYPTDFGVELEVSARQATGTGMKSTLEQMATGVAKGFLPKGETSDNMWTFVTGSKLEMLPEPPVTNTEGDYVFSQICNTLSAQPGGASLLERKLVTLENSSFELEAAEVLLVLRQVGCNVTADQVEALVERFAANRKGFLDCRELRKALRAALTTTAL